MTALTGTKLRSANVDIMDWVVLRSQTTNSNALSAALATILNTDLTAAELLGKYEICLIERLE